MTATHEILVVEDDPQNAEVLRDIVQSMDFRCRIVTTLDEVRVCLASFEPCAVLQDMQIPHVAGARPHEKAGESSIRLVRKRSNGRGRVPIIVVTAFRSDPDYVWEMSEAEADGFVAKSNIGVLAGKLAAALKKNGRELHSSCVACNVESRPAENVAREAAVLFSHERRGVVIDALAVQALHDQRAEHDLFLDYAGPPDTRGYVAGFRDHRRVFREAFLAETSAAILAELVEARKPIRADALRRLKHGGQASAVRLVQQARKAVDVHVMMHGKESRKEWRAFHTVGGKGATAFVFEPPAGMKYAVIVNGGRGE